MTLYQATPNGRVALSEEEEAEFIARKKTMAVELPERKAAYARTQRNNLLASSDWTQASDSPLTDEVKASWVTYRTALRNLSNHSNWPSLEDSDWPTKP